MNEADRHLSRGIAVTLQAIGAATVLGCLALGIWLTMGQAKINRDESFVQQVQKTAPANQTPIALKPSPATAPVETAPAEPQPAPESESASADDSTANVEPAIARPEPARPFTASKTLAFMPGQALNFPNRKFRKIEVRSEYPLRVLTGRCHQDYTVEFFCEGDPADIFVADTRPRPLFHTPRANSVTITVTEF